MDPLPGASFNLGFEDIYRGNCLFFSFFAHLTKDNNPLPSHLTYKLIMAPAWLEKFIVRVDANPDPRRNTERPVLEMHYTVLIDHRRIIGVVGDRTPRYEVRRETVFGAWGDKCHVISPLTGGKGVASIDFHSIPSSKTEILFLQRHHTAFIKANDGEYESNSGLGSLRWKPTGMVAYGKASWELRDKSDLVMSVIIDDDHINGVISLWKQNTDLETVEELAVVGIAKIEEYKRLMRTSMRSGVLAATSVAWLAAA